MSFDKNNVGCSVQINGKCFNAPPNASISVLNNRVIINGQEVTEGMEAKEIHISVNGNIEKLEANASDITVTGDVGSLSTVSGDVDIRGNVRQGASSTSGDIRVSGSIEGDTRTVSGDISCNR